MAFRATTVVTQQAFDELRRLAFSSQAYLENRRVLLVGAQVSASVPLELINHFRTTVARMNLLAATPGLAEYAKAQVDDPTYDIAAEFLTMRNAMVAARDDLIARVPRDANGFLLFQQMAADGTVSLRTFTQAQMAPVVALVDAVIATIS